MSLLMKMRIPAKVGAIIAMFMLLCAAVTTYSALHFHQHSIQTLARIQVKDEVVLASGGVQTASSKLQLPLASALVDEQPTAANIKQIGVRHRQFLDAMAELRAAVKGIVA